MRSSFLARGCALLAAIVAASSAHAYFLIGRSWASGDIVMHLQLGTSSTALSDGSTSWNTLAENALNDWNQYISRSRFTVVRDSTAARQQGNRINNVFFSSTVYGESWGSGVLAVTLSQRSSRSTTEADVLFNRNLQWDSYRGALRRSTMDFQRVALHEFGHVLGLDHPDDAVPAQNVSALMNSVVGNLDGLQPDDIAGARILYSSTAAASIAPSILTQPAGGSVQVTGSQTFTVAAGGTAPLTYEWFFRPAGTTTEEPLFFAEGPSLTIGSVQPADAGTYYAVVSNASGSVTTNPATLNVTPIALSADTTLANLSTRGTVGGGQSALIVGFVISGTTSKNVVVRAVGPGLATFGVTAPLGDPDLTVFDSNGRVVARNDNWESGGSTAAELSSAFSRVGAFQLKSGARDAALLLTLPPGNYSAHVNGIGGTTGVAMVETYDADSDAATARSRRFLNVATRGPVGTGDRVMIAGLVVSGPGPRTYLIRGVGPTLGSAPHNVSGTLPDPVLQLYRGETLLRENDDWDSPASAQAALREAARRVGAFNLLETRGATTGLDAAMLVTLPPGNYTAKLSDLDNAIGIGLIEIYEVP